jgi:hypothetical protein
MYAAYDDFVSELVRPEMIAIYEAQLKEAGLWERFPSRNDFDSLAEYAKGLELHAGTEPGLTLRVLGDRIVFDPPLSSFQNADFEECYSKLVLVVGYAAVRDRINFGFFANGKAAD